MHVELRNTEILVPDTKTYVILGIPKLITGGDRENPDGIMYDGEGINILVDRESKIIYRLVAQSDNIDEDTVLDKHTSTGKSVDGDSSRVEFNSISIQLSIAYGRSYYFYYKLTDSLGNNKSILHKFAFKTTE